MLAEFKKFIMKGNVLDLAVAVIIGAAFGKVITSLVNDIIMPPIGMLLGGVNFADLFISLNGQKYASLADAQAAGAPTINWGLFVNTIIDFVIVALVIFLLIKAFNKLQKPVVAPVTTKDCPFCARAIPLKATRCPECTSQL